MNKLKFTDENYLLVINVLYKDWKMSKRCRNLIKMGFAIQKTAFKSNEAGSTETLKHVTKVYISDPKYIKTHSLCVVFFNEINHES